MTEQVQAFGVTYVDPWEQAWYGFVRADSKREARKIARQFLFYDDKIAAIEGPYQKDPNVVMNA